MEKKQYTAPKAELMETTFEDIIVASGTGYVYGRSIELPPEALGE